MNESARGGLIVGIIIVAIAAYYFLWMDHPAPAPATGDPETVGAFTTAYLEKEPVVPNSAAIEVGSRVPDFTYMTIRGEEIRLSDYAGVKPVVIDMWATWCSPCLRELPLLQNLYNSYSDDLEIIAISSENASAANGIVQKVTQLGLTFKVMHDPSLSLSKLFPSTGIPYVVLIGKNGTVLKSQMGFSPNIEADILEAFGIS